jgi:hypothetical protein
MMAFAKWGEVAMAKHVSPIACVCVPGDLVKAVGGLGSGTVVRIVDVMKLFGLCEVLCESS